MFSKGLTQCTPVNYSIVDDVLRNPRVTRNFKKPLIFELRTICTQLKLKLSMQTRSSDHLIKILPMTTYLKNGRYAARDLHTIEMKVITADKILRPPDRNFVNNHESQKCPISARDLHTIEMKVITADKIHLTTWPPYRNFVNVHESQKCPIFAHNLHTFEIEVITSDNNLKSITWSTWSMSMKFKNGR